MLSRIFSAIISDATRWMLSGAAATIVLMIFMEGVASVVLGAPMKPAALICQVFGWDRELLWFGELLHYGLALVVFPIGFVVVRTIAGFGPAVLTGAVWGFILWIGASTVLAPMAGMPAFFGGGKVMMASLVAHLAYGIVLGAIYGNRRGAYV